MPEKQEGHERTISRGNIYVGKSKGTEQSKEERN